MKVGPALARINLRRIGVKGFIFHISYFIFLLRSRVGNEDVFVAVARQKDNAAFAFQSRGERKEKAPTGNPVGVWNGASVPEVRSAGDHRSAAR